MNEFRMKYYSHSIQRFSLIWSMVKWYKASRQIIHFWQNIELVFFVANSELWNKEHVEFEMVIHK